MTLQWHQHQHDANCYVTACGRYSISTRDGVWDAWRLAPGGPWFAPLAQKLPDRTTAERTCAEDSQKSTAA